MTKPISNFRQSLKQLAEIQVNDWDFMALMNKDIKEVEFAKSLRKLGNLQVMEWDFRTVLPTMSEFAQQEIDVPGILRRTANYKVLDWDFRKSFFGEGESALSQEARQKLIGHLKDFLQFVAISLIDEPSHMQIKIQEIQPDVLRLKLVLTQKDAAMIIGTGGHTAAAIRRIVKAVALEHGIRVLLQIQSHQEETAEMEAVPKPDCKE